MFVVNGAGVTGGLPDVDAPDGRGGRSGGSGGRGGRWKKILDYGKTGAGVLLKRVAPTAIVAGALESLIGSYTTDEKVLGSASILSSTATGAAIGSAGGPVGTFLGGLGGFGYGLVQNADRFTNSNLTQPNPTVDGAMDKFFQANLKHEVKLNANIKIETATSDEALTKFRQELDAQVLQPFMLSQLNGALSTTSNYAK